MNFSKAKKSKISLGLIGTGTVGGGVLEILRDQKKFLKNKLGFDLEIKKVATLVPTEAQHLGVNKSQIVASWKDIVNDPEIDIVIELIGGTGVAKEIICQSIQNKKQVVTANKALLAMHGKEIFDLAARHEAQVCFEASVGGGIPVLRALREAFAACEINSLQAIINGTCNYILSEMADKGAGFQQTLKEAQRLGYAEQDPTFDIEGIDAAHKLCILISMAFGVFVPLKQIYTQGITELSPLDFECANRFGYCIKLLAIAKKNQDGLEARVHPTMIPLTSPLSSVKDVFNAILIEGTPLGRSLFYGRGAGRGPTASAVMGDVVEIARRLVSGSPVITPPLGFVREALQNGKLKALEKINSAYYLRFSVLDRPGALSKITGLLGKEGISIASVYQHELDLGKKVPVVLLTHPSSEEKMQKALKKIDRLSFIKEKTLRIRIEHG
ncbi:MAG: homoserine dehydrogenase [Deltaproteobacteria bacterium]|nr:homoserine dehydrogenase [Deltaproteobacteria bacterium]